MTDRLSPTFAFLERYELKLALLPTLAELYLHQDPNTAIIKIRQYGELLANRLFTHARLPLVAGADSNDRLKHLEKEEIIPADVAKVFHDIRRKGNDAVHQHKGSISEAVQCLSDALWLGHWYHAKTLGKAFAPRKYSVPKEPADTERDFQQRVARLEQELAKAHAESTQAERKRIDAELARDSIAAKLHQQEKAHRDSLREGNLDRPTVWAEQKYHLDQFVGRKALTDSLVRELTTKSAGYLVVTGVPGVGKSALLARLAHEVAARKGAAKVPVLLYLAKSGGAERQILGFLIWQASRDLQKTLPRSVFSKNTLELRELFVSSLVELQQKYGRVVVIIDGLDEMISDHEAPGKDLVFLPDYLPDGVRILLACRPVESVLQHLDRRFLGHQRAVLGPLNQAETNELVSARSNEKTLSWLEARGGTKELALRTQGSPLLLARALKVAAAKAEMDSAKAEDGNESWIPETIGAVFADQLREIANPTGVRKGRGQRTRLAVLELIAAASEPIGAEEIRRALAMLGQRVEMRGVRAALSELSGVLIALGGEVFRLYHHGFAEYVLSRVGDDDEISLHRALAGKPLGGIKDIEARVVPHVAHLATAFERAQSAGASELAQEVLKQAWTSMFRGEVIACAVASHQLADLCAALERLAPSELPENQSLQHAQLATLCRFLIRNHVLLEERPSLLRQQLLHEPSLEALIDGDSRGAVGGPHFRKIWSSSEVDRTLIREFQHSEDVNTYMVNGVLAARHAPFFVIKSNENEVLGVWNRDSGRRLWERQLGLERIVGEVVAISDDGGHVALSTYTYTYPIDADGEEDTDADPTGTLGGMLMLDGQTGNKLWEIEPRLAGGVAAIEFSPDGKEVYVVSGHARFSKEHVEPIGIHCLSTENGEVLRESERDVRIGPVAAARVLRGGSTLLTVGESDRQLDRSEWHGQIAAWDTSNLDQAPTLLSTGQSAVTCVCERADGVAVVGNSSGQIGRLNLKQGSVQWWDTTLDRVNYCAFLPSNLLILHQMGFLSFPGAVGRWSLEEQLMVGEHIPLDPDVREVALGWSDHEWLVDTKSRVAMMSLAETFAEARQSRPSLKGKVVTLSPDLRLASVMLDDYSMEIVEIASGKRQGEAIVTSARLQHNQKDLYLHIADRGWQEGKAHVRLANDGTVLIIDDVMRDLLVSVRLISTRTGKDHAHGICGPSVIHASVSADGRVASVVVRPQRKLDALPPKHREAVQDIFNALSSMANRDVSVEAADPDSFQLSKTVAALSLENKAVHAPTKKSEGFEGFPKNLSMPCLIVLETHSARVVSVSPLDQRYSEIRLSSHGRHVGLENDEVIEVRDTKTGDVALSVSKSRERQSIGARFAEQYFPSERPSQAPEQAELERTFDPTSWRFSEDEERLQVSGNVARWWSTLRQWKLETAAELGWSPIRVMKQFHESIDGKILFTPVNDGLSAIAVLTGKEVAFWPRYSIDRVAVRDEGRICIWTENDQSEVVEYLEK